jgi:hypothetical protein
VSRARLSPVLTLAVAAAGLSFAVLGQVACGTTSNAETFPPITGITILAESLTVGRGCGRGTTEIYKYAAIVLGQSPTNSAVHDTVVASNVYDCFTDGLFVNLPASAVGSFDYVVEIYAYNAAAYAAAGGDARVRVIAGDRNALKQTAPTFTTTCLAEQTDQVQSLAVCQPIAFGAAGVGVPTSDATVSLSLATFKGADGGAFACDADYATVRSRYAIGGGALSAITDTRCSAASDGGVAPVTFTVAPASAPASYTFQVALLRANGTQLGTTTCGAETSPGLASSAVCQPVR